VTAPDRTASRWEPSRWEPGAEGDARVYFGSVRPGTQEPGEPQAFIVRYPAGHEGYGVHYHPVDQFQVFIAGSGRFGRRDVRPGMAHYADALTPYGPIAVGPDGVAFMTIRHQHDFDIQHMPDEAAQLAELRRRSERGPAKRRNLLADLAAPHAPGSWVPAFADDDGLEVATRTLEAAEAIPRVAAKDPGAYLLLVDGTLEVGDDTLRPGSLAWTTPERGELASGVAGPSGAQLALLQFPSQPSDLEISDAFLAVRAASGAR
jgi:hypothetical protein